MNIQHAYALFCDTSGLPRINATAEQHINNINIMAGELLELSERFHKEIACRCPVCRGSGQSRWHLVNVRRPRRVGGFVVVVVMVLAALAMLIYS